MVNELTYEDVVDGLRRLLDGNIDEISFGICENLGVLVGNRKAANNLVYFVSRYWPECDKEDKDFPIRDINNELSAAHQYSIISNLWQGNQLIQRQKLIHFMLDNEQLLREAIDKVNSGKTKDDDDTQ